MAERYDVLVIGSGPGGYVAALRASQLGARVALVEEKTVGGVCLNVGCIPTKALLRSAEALELVRGAQEFGIRVEGEVTPDWPAIQKRKERIVNLHTRGVASLLKRAKVTVYAGRGRLAGPPAGSQAGGAFPVDVASADGTERVEAEKVILATGARPVYLPMPGFDLPGVLDSTGALDLEALPGRLLIVGGGVIGCEFASVYAAFGVQVTIVEMLDRLLPMMDAEVSAEIARAFKKTKIVSHLASRANNITAAGDALRVAFTTPEGEQTIEVDKVLVSVGRRSNVEELGLEDAGVRVERGIPVNERMETNVPGVYAVGDVTGQWWLAHVASRGGVVAAENACGHPARIDYKAVPSCVFTFPEVASVGLTEEQAREQGYEVLVGKFPFAANAKASIYGDRQGFVKVVAEAKYGEVLGLHIVGPHASDLILEGGLALSMEATLDEIEATIHAHPTLGETIHEAALAARGIALHV
jgi:dihydrolipoamide dehydrogenase